MDDGLAEVPPGHRLAGRADQTVRPGGIFLAPAQLGRAALGGGLLRENLRQRSRDRRMRRLVLLEKLHGRGEVFGRRQPARLGDGLLGRRLQPQALLFRGRGSDLGAERQRLAIPGRERQRLVHGLRRGLERPALQVLACLRDAFAHGVGAIGRGRDGPPQRAQLGLQRGAIVAGERQRLGLADPFGGQVELSARERLLARREQPARAPDGQLRLREALQVHRRGVGGIDGEHLVAAFERLLELAAVEGVARVDEPARHLSAGRARRQPRHVRRLAGDRHRGFVDRVLGAAAQPPADAAQVGVHLAEVLVALLGPLAHGARHDGHDLAIDVGNQLLERRRLVVQDVVEDGVAVGAEGAGVGEELVEHEPDREHVAAMIGDARVDLLGRHVVRRPHDGADARQFLLAGALLADPRDAEVENLDDAVGVDLDVRRLHVAMDDAGAVRVGQAAAHVLDDAQLPGDGQTRTALHDGPERLARHVLHHDVRRVVVLADLEHRHDVGVAQAPGRARLAGEALAQLRAVEAVAQQLDGDEAVDRGIAPEVYDGHAALAEQPDDFVGTDAVGDGAHNLWARRVADARRPATSAGDAAPAQLLRPVWRDAIGYNTWPSGPTIFRR